jgi:hypothetical protein
VNYLGTVTGASGGYNNQSTGNSGIAMPFHIPPGVKELYLVSSASGVLFELFYATGPSGSTFNTTTARGAQLAGPGVISGPFRCLHTSPDRYTVVSIFHAQSGFHSVRVYSAPTD